MDMIRDREAWMAWERQYLRDTPVDFYRNLRLYEALYEQARRLGMLPSKEPLAELGDKIRLAEAIHVSGTTRSARPRT
jgi:hypothetical protein